MPDFEFDNLAAGLNYRDTDVALGKNQNIYWKESANVKPFQGIGLEKCKGNTLIADHGTEIVSAGNYSLGNDEYIMFADSSGGVYEYDTTASSTSSVLVTELDGDARGAWVTYGQGIIYSNGVDEPFIYFRDRSTTVTGTVAVTISSKNVTGTNTVFESQLQIGDSITINSEKHIIATIVDDTHLTTRTNFAATASGKTVIRNKITYLIAVGRDGTILRSTAIATYKGRVYIAQDGGIFYTALGTYTDWLTVDDAGYNKNFFNDSSTIQALSLFGDFLAIHRKGQIILLQDIEGTPENFIYAVATNRGSSSQFGAITIQNEHIFFDSGIFPLGKSGAVDQTMLQDELTVNINNTFLGFLNGSLDTSRADEVTLLHYRDQRELWCYFPLDDVSYFQYVYVYDYQRGAWHKRVSPQEITCAIEHKNFIYSFDTGGKIYKEDIGSTWNEVDIDFYVQTAYLNFGEAHKQKDVDEIKIILDTKVNNNFYYKYFFDYDNYNTSPTQYINITGDNASLIWSDDSGSITSTEWANDAGTSGNNWAQTVLTSSYLDRYNGFMGISIYFYGSGETQDLGIIGLKFFGVQSNSV
jgi:hypothetical protein